MRPEARQALADLIREHGKSIVRMPSSCRMFLTLKLGDFPEERDLFALALERGVPDRILAEAGTDDYEEKLDEMAASLAADGVDPDEAAGAVTAWAEALNRPVGYRPKAPDRLYPEEPKPDPKTEKTVRLLMTLIAGAGGFLGAGIGAVAVPIVFVSTDLLVDDTPTLRPQLEPGLVAVMLVVRFLLTGVTCGLAAAGGWVCGKGDERPWAGFAAAFGAGLTMSLFLLSYVATIARVITVALAVFGAAFTAAARGGYKS